MNRIWLFAVLGAGFFAAPGLLRAGTAASSGTGTLQTVLLAPDAAALAAGGAAGAADAFAVLHSPAALSFAERHDGWGYSYARWSGDLSLHTLSGFHVFNDGQGLMMSVRYGHQTPWDVPGTDEYGRDAGTWRACPTEWLVEAGYTARASTQDAVALSARWTSSRVASPLPTAGALAFDFNFVHRIAPSATSRTRWQWMLSLNNLGGKFDYGGSPVSQPLRVSGALSGRSSGNNRLSVSYAFETGFLKTDDRHGFDAEAGCWMGWRGRYMLGAGLYRDWNRAVSRVSCGVECCTGPFVLSGAFVPYSGDAMFRHASSVSIQTLF